MERLLSGQSYEQAGGMSTFLHGVQELLLIGVTREGFEDCASVPSAGWFILGPERCLINE